MHKDRIKEKAVILFIVLATIFIVTLLGNIILAIVSSQSRLTHHKLSRIQGYYAAMAGVNYALEQLRTGLWSSTTAGSYSLPNDSAFPTSIQQPITITITPNTTLDNSDGCSAPVLGLACISTTATFTYTP